MTTKWVDCLVPPSAGAAEAVWRNGYRAWGLYVVMDGTDDPWPVEACELVLDIGFSVLAIVGPSASLAGTDYAIDLVDRGLLACEERGIARTSLAIDIENFEIPNPHMRPTVNGFQNRTRQRGARPVVYSSGYTGNAHVWLPRWTANAGEIGPSPEMPGAGNAIQWAGNIEGPGVLVDLNFAGDGFPFAGKAS